MKDMFLLRFGDLVLKGKNKPTFINQVRRILKEKLKGLNVEYEFQHDRIIIHTEKDERDKVIKSLNYVSGLHSYSMIYRTTNQIDEIAKLAKEVILSESKKPGSMKIETKRADKRFPMTSLEISQAVSKIILPELQGFTVDVKNPEYKLEIEVRHDGAYIFMSKVPLLGGFPIGLNGKGLVMLSGGIDSPVAAYLMMKQGVEVELFHFESTPLTPLESVQKVIDISKKLAHFMPKNTIKLHLVPFIHIHETILSKVSDPYIITIMRRMMYRLAERYALSHNILALVNGESVGQVASQTLDSIRVVENVTNIPILRPVITDDKNRIIDISKKIDTFDISIRPFSDCCAIYVPKNPITHPKLEKCLEEEQKFDFEPLLKEALEGIETLYIKPDTELIIADFGFEVKDAIENYKNSQK